MGARVEHVNPDGLIKNPAFTQAVAITGPARTVLVGAQNDVDGNGNIVGKGDIGAQTEQDLKNIDICLAAAGARKEHIVSWSIYLLAGEDLQAAFGNGGRARRLGLTRRAPGRPRTGRDDRLEDRQLAD